MTRFILLILTICFTISVQAQEIKNEYIIKLKRGQIDRFIKQIVNNDSRSISNTRILSKDLNVIEIKTRENADSKFEQSLGNNPLIEGWGYNVKTHKRAEPNDEYYNIQWGLEMIKAAEAWNVTTGGTDIEGREIVIAVLDDGFDLDHPELAGRFLLNAGEIENYGI